VVVTQGAVAHPQLGQLGGPGGGSAGRGGLVEELDQLVRAVVRRDGVDPQREPERVRRIAEAVVAEHDERSLTGAVAPVPEVGAMVGELVARVSGFGPLQPFLDDPSVEEIWINDPSRVFVARRGRHELTNLVLTRDQVAELVERMLKSSGRRIDVSTPFVDAMLPEGHRLHVVLEGISRGFTAVNTANPNVPAASHSRSRRRGAIRRCQLARCVAGRGPQAVSRLGHGQLLSAAHSSRALGTSRDVPPAGHHTY